MKVGLLAVVLPGFAYLLEYTKKKTGGIGMATKKYVSFLKRDRGNRNGD